MAAKRYFVVRHSILLSGRLDSAKAKAGITSTSEAIRRALVLYDRCLSADRVELVTDGVREKVELGAVKPH